MNIDILFAILLLILSFIIIYNLVLEYKNRDKKKYYKKQYEHLYITSSKLSRGDLYRLLMLQLIPFIICELYKEKKFFDINNPLKSKAGEILLILFTYILYSELLFYYI
ncbi:hypothetical protein Hokovirus_3_161 [Hokovirus HKV1]|uniref:Uncharacterized protein n=1 Tax=Hokovirus HKV1 TaxID=1977638 RepID=A0A1V0SGX3_9VIRU|nr:hypothetical protein Hokovirus_3_161 [Hokovirus HKV1]